tara:strand:+ start:612 stop:1283 length:672 start_codon:yes stop_codon:yes gene_type:complete
MHNFGEIVDFISDAELRKVAEVMSGIPHSNAVRRTNTKSSFNSIGIGHQLYSWFGKIVLDKLKNFFPEEPKLLFASYCNEEQPFTVHSDYYHKRIGTPYFAILLPISVDNSTSNMHLSKTIIFNQQDTYVDESVHDNRTYTRDNFKKTHNKVLEGNSSWLHDEELSHCEKEDLERLTIAKIVPWAYGNAIYWDEKMLHCSNNFHKKGIKSKQHIIIHTYIEEK